jgi:DNA repair protein RadA
MGEENVEESGVIESKLDEKIETEEQKLNSLPGVGAATVEKLMVSGFDNLMSISVASPGQLVEVTGITEATARKIIYAARDKMDMGFESGEELLKKRAEIIKLTTGCKAFDDMLKGGFETSAISECFGEFGSSKSQIAHVLAVRTQMSKDQGGAEGSVIFLDGESTFRPERIIQIAKGLDLDSEEILRNIKVARCFNSDHQMLLAEKSEDIIKTGINDKPVRLIIVDSLTSHFRADFSGRGELAIRQQKLNRHMHVLMKLASQYNLCVYVTNQVMAKPDMFFGDPTAAIGGNIVGHNCLLEGTLIQLPDGRTKKIEEIYDENQVLSVDLCKDFKSKKTNIKTVVVKKKGKVYNIQTTHRISSSAEHRFFTLDNFQIKEVMAKDLTEGQYILHGFNFEIEGNMQKLPEMNQPKLVTISSEGSQIILDSINETRERICNNLNITPRQLRRVLNQNYPTDSSNLDLLVKMGVSEDVRQYTDEYYTNKHKNIEIPEFLDENLSQIFGYYLGDGYIDKRSVTFKDERLEVLCFYKNLFSKLTGINGHIRKVSNKNCFELQINSKSIRNLFEKIKEDLFDYIGKSPNCCVAAFVKGFFDADGSIDLKSGCVSAAQKSDDTIIRIQLFLDRLGIRSKIRKYIHNENWINQLDLRDNESVMNFAELIGFTAKDKLHKLNEVLSRMKFSQLMTPVKREDLKNLIRDFGEYPSKILRPRNFEFVGERELSRVLSYLVSKVPIDGKTREKLDFLITLENSNLKWEKISKISVENTDRTFYDFGVANMENYMANGFVVHNSQTRIYLRKGKKGTRVGKLIDSPWIEDSECIFKVTENGMEDV